MITAWFLLDLIRYKGVTFSGKLCSLEMCRTLPQCYLLSQPGDEIS